MYFIRLISILIISITLSGCEFNLGKLDDLKYRVDRLQEKNDALTKELASNKIEISSRNEELDNCYGEIEKHKSGWAEKHDMWFKIALGATLFISLLFISWLMLDYYSIKIKAPKEEEIEKSKELIENEKYLVEKIKAEAEKARSQVSQLNQNKSSLLGEIHQLEIYLEERKNEVAEAIEAAEAKNEAALAKAAETEKKLKLLYAFKK